MYLNDQLGDCVIAAGYHIVGCETGNASGTPFVATDAQIIHDYSAIGGYVPGNEATDQGCDMQTALNYWTKTGFQDRSKLTAWLSVDASNESEVKAAVYLFGNVFIGMSLPDAWVDPFPAGPGFTWDVAGASVPENGHAIMAVGYTPAGLLIDTWGMVGTLTWRALAEYAVQANGGELYVMLTPDQLASGQTQAPNGIAWASLLSDWNVMGGSVPVPVPPTPTPVPVPPAPVPVPPIPAPKPMTISQATHQLLGMIATSKEHGAMIVASALETFLLQLGG